MKDYFAFRDRPNIGNYPSFFNADYLATDKIEKKLGHKCQELLYIWKDERVRIVLITKNDFEILSSKILEKIKSDKNFVSNERQKSLSIISAYLGFCKQNLQVTKLEKTQNKEIAAMYDKVCKFHSDFSFYNVPLWFVVGDVFADFLIKSLTPYTDKAQEVFTVLSKPTIASYLYIYNSLLFQLRQRLIKKQNSEDLLNKFEKNFYWIPFDYVGPDIWKRKDFLKQARENLDKPESLEKVKRQQVQTADKLKLPNSLRRLFLDFQISQVTSDEKKEFLTKAQIYWQKVLVLEISKRISVPVELIRFMTPQEIRQALTSGKIPKRLDARPIRSIFKQTSEGVEIIYGAKVDKLYQEFNPESTQVAEVSGRVASMGQARGTAKILLSPKEIGKVKQGDILIATMTTPDYVIAMKKAAGIITDEGGITSHAAIVSREFGIPCIVGTSIATKIFKDGDLVEIDTDSGVARKV